MVFVVAGMVGFQPNPECTSRRKVLKTVGSTTAGLAVGSASTVGTASATTDNVPDIELLSKEELEAIVSEYRSEKEVQNLVDQQDRLLGLLSRDGVLGDPDLKIRNVHTEAPTEGDAAFDEDGTFVWGTNSEHGAHARIVIRRTLERGDLRVILYPGTDVHPRAKVVPEQGPFTAYYEPGAPDVPDRTAAIRSQRVDPDSLSVGVGDDVQVSSISASGSFTVTGYAFNGCWEQLCNGSQHCWAVEYRCANGSCYREDCTSAWCCGGNCTCCNMDWCCASCGYEDPCDVCCTCELKDGSCCTNNPEDCYDCDCNSGCDTSNCGTC